MNRQAKVDAIREVLKDTSLAESLEVLANVLILEGLSFMEDIPNELTPLTIFDYVSQQIKQNGQTLSSSTVMLGIDLLTALEKA